MGNIAEQLFGLSKRYAAGERPTGGGLFTAMAYKMSRSPAFQKHYGQAAAQPVHQPPMQPPHLLVPQFATAMPTAMGAETDPYRQPANEQAQKFRYMHPFMQRSLG